MEFYWISRDFKLLNLKKLFQMFFIFIVSIYLFKPFLILWLCMGMHVCVWSCMGMFGHGQWYYEIWINMVLYGHIWLYIWSFMIFSPVMFSESQKNEKLTAQGI